MVALYFMFYNFGRVHQALRVTPAMEAGISDHVWAIEEIIAPSEQERMVVRCERLREQAEEFQRTVEEELRTIRMLIEDLRVNQAKRRGHGRRMD